MIESIYLETEEKLDEHIRYKLQVYCNCLSNTLIYFQWPSSISTLPLQPRPLSL